MTAGLLGGGGLTSEVDGSVFGGGGGGGLTSEVATSVSNRTARLC